MGDGSLWVVANGDLWKFQNDAWQAKAGVWPTRLSALWKLVNDREGNAWFSRFGIGLVRLASDGQLQILNAHDGLPSDLVRCLYQDREGNLWVGLDRGGLVRLRKKNVACISYGKSDGLPALEFSGGLLPAGWRGRDGRLWFGTDNGLISLQPSAITINSLPPPVAVESLPVDGKLFVSSRKISTSVFDLGRSLRIPAGRTQFEFHYTGLSFTAPDKVRFQYRLEGLQKDWVEPAVPTIKIRRTRMIIRPRSLCRTMSSPFASFHNTGASTDSGYAGVLRKWAMAYGMFWAQWMKFFGREPTARYRPGFRRLYL